MGTRAQATLKALGWLAAAGLLFFSYELLRPVRLSDIPEPKDPVGTVKYTNYVACELHEPKDRRGQVVLMSQFFGYEGGHTKTIYSLRGEKLGADHVGDAFVQFEVFETTDLKPVNCRHTTTKFFLRRVTSPETDAYWERLFPGEDRYRKTLFDIRWR